MSWNELLDIGRELPDAKLDERLRRLAINHCCTVVYTSGTNRPQRGVMLSHDNLTWGSKMVLGVIRAPGFNRLPVPGEEVIMSYLPHSEIASQTVWYSTLLMRFWRSFCAPYVISNCVSLCLRIFRDSSLPNLTFLLRSFWVPLRSFCALFTLLYVFLQYLHSLVLRSDCSY